MVKWLKYKKIPNQTQKARYIASFKNAGKQHQLFLMSGF